MYMGQSGKDNTDEMIYTAKEFILVAVEIQLPDDQYIIKFLMCVETQERDVLKRIIDEHTDNGATYMPGQAGLRALVKQWTVQSSGDPEPLETLTHALFGKGQKHWKMENDQSVDDVDKRLNTLIGYAQWIENNGEPFWSVQKQTKIRLRAYPTSWFEQFVMQNPDMQSVSDKQIVKWMRQKAAHSKGNKNDKKRDRSNDSDGDRDKKKSKKDKKNKDKKKKGKYKIDPSKSSGPTAKCSYHPDADHAWGDCIFNSQSDI